MVAKSSKGKLSKSTQVLLKETSCYETLWEECFCWRRSVSESIKDFNTNFEVAHKNDSYKTELIFLKKNNIVLGEDWSNDKNEANKSLVLFGTVWKGEH